MHIIEDCTRTTPDQARALLRAVYLMRFARNLTRWLRLSLWLNLSGRHLWQKGKLTGPRFARRPRISWTGAIAMMVGRANGVV
jgi:hypothetical protein